MTDTQEVPQVSALPPPSNPELAVSPVIVSWMENFRAVTSTFRDVTDRIVSHPIQNLVGQRKHYLVHQLSILKEDDFAVGFLQNEQCSICLDSGLEIQAQTQNDHEPDDSPQKTGLVSLLDSCKHTFCRKDLLTWLEHSNACPLCRTPIYADEATVYRVQFELVQHGAICLRMRRALGQVEDEIKNALGRLRQAAASGSDSPAEVEPSVILPQVEAERAEPDSVVSGEEEGNSSAKSPSEPVNNPLADAFNVALSILKTFSEFFTEISDDMSYVSDRMSESDIFASFIVSASTLERIQAFELERAGDAEVGTDAGTGPAAAAGAGDD